MLSGSRCRVLHVDDDSENQRTVADLIRRARPECAIVTARTGTEALELLGSEAFALVIVEPWAAEINGFKICRRIREQDPHTPVIFYSWIEHMNGRKFAEAAGGSGYFTPAENDLFIDAVARLLLEGDEKIRLSPIKGI